SRIAIADRVLAGATSASIVLTTVRYPASDERCARAGVVVRQKMPRVIATTRTRTRAATVSALSVMREKISSSAIRVVGGPNHLRQGYGGPPKPAAKAEGPPLRCGNCVLPRSRKLRRQKTYLTANCQMRGVATGPVAPVPMPANEVIRPNVRRL